MVRAQSMRRDGVHSRWRWWALGMWAGSVVCRPRTTLRMRGDALAAMEDLDGRRGQAGVDVCVDQRVGDGVVMAVELDVIVDADAGADPPVAVDEGLRRKRAERGPIQLLEELAPAGAVEAHRPGIEIREELGDAGVEGGEGEEGLVTEASEDPPLHDLDGDFNFRFVPGFGRARGQ